jgi:cation channel sperm-associated protein subunit delta
MGLVRVWWEGFKRRRSQCQLIHLCHLQNYISCHEHNKDMPLRWPNAEYQVLGGKTDNEIIFDQRNGIYIFYLSIVDPYYR